MGLSRDAVIWGFRFILGREPESEAVIAAHSAARDPEHLADLLMRSPEFISGQRFTRLLAAHSESGSSHLPTAHLSTSNARFLLLGNCQVRPLARLIQALTGNAVATTIELLPKNLERLRTDRAALGELIGASDLILFQPYPDEIRFITEAFPGTQPKLRLIPRISFAAFHPDVDYVENANGRIAGCIGQYHSALAFYGWTRGLSPAQTRELFRDEVFASLGYYDYWDAARALLLAEGVRAALPLDELLDRWSRVGLWMHTMNHPKLFALADLAHTILAREGIATIAGADEFVADEFSARGVWPVYPEIAQRLSLEGHYHFKPPRDGLAPTEAVIMLGLEEFIRASFDIYSGYDTGELHCARLESERYQALDARLTSTRSPGQSPGPHANTDRPGADGYKPRHPYQDLADYHFWRRAVEAPAMTDVDPVTAPLFAVEKTDKVATAGSCFAQHLSRTLKNHGFTYFVAEQAPGLAAEEVTRRNYGTFSARYGNLYTARQLLQLFDRAYGQFVPRDAVWKRADNQLVDPFRPQIEPDGFDTAEALEASRREHFAAVRTMLETLDVLVFTFGLTESWRSRADGAILPLAPGVAGGEMTAGRYEFVNFSVADVVSDMQSFIARLRSVNPRARLLLTVSPVPLVATYEQRHVLVSNTLSKAVLRAAADEICRSNALCDYFPSFEIITGNHARGCYFDSDLRSVRPEGVEHVMRVFMRHYSHGPGAARDQDLVRELTVLNDVVCDEEALEPPPGVAVAAA